MLTFRARSNQRFFGSSGDGGASGGASAGAGGGAGGAPRATVALIPGGRRSSRIEDLFPSALKMTTASRARPTARLFDMALPRFGVMLTFASSSKWAKRHSRAPAAWRWGVWRLPANDVGLAPPRTSRNEFASRRNAPDSSVDSHRSSPPSQVTPRHFV